jgi:hypothetical protein
MKTVWRKAEFEPQINADERGLAEKEICVHPRPSAVDELNPIWTMPAPGSDEKAFGKHPTQKPVALVERCLLASTSEGERRPHDGREHAARGLGKDTERKETRRRISSNAQTEILRPRQRAGCARFP